MLGCAGSAQDSIEHYCRCPVTQSILARKLNLLPSLFANLHTFLLCNSCIASQDELASIALLIYAIYSATNRFRHQPPPADADIQEAVTQWLREGARNHSNATEVLDNRWNPHRRTTPLPPIPIHI